VICTCYPFHNIISEYALIQISTVLVMSIPAIGVLHDDTVELIRHTDHEDDRDERDEAGPLLPSASQPRLYNDGEEVHKPFDKLILYFMIIHFLLGFCQIILVAPLIRLFENSICMSHYGFPVNGVEESLCKIIEIQGPLATIRGWKSTLDTIPVLVVAIPLGRMGDIWGRRKILMLSLVGVVLSLVEIFIVCELSIQGDIDIMCL